jgi:hypothetical protein
MEAGGAKEAAGATVMPEAETTAGAVGVEGKAQAHWLAHEELVATQPGPLFRLQQEDPLPEPQQDMLLLARSCWRGAA